MLFRVARARVCLACCGLLLMACPHSDAKQPPAKAKVAPYSLERPAAGLALPAPRPARFHRGVILGPLSGGDKDPKRRKHYAALLDQARSLGASHVALLVNWSQPDVQAVEITPHPGFGLDDRLLTWVMDQARTRELEVFLRPVFDLQETQREGQTREHLEPASWERWWWSYQRFLLHYARMAQRHGAVLFSVGSKLSTAESQAERWKALIGEVRKLYKGQLVYSAKWDRLDQVSFWAAVDVAGAADLGEVSQVPSASDAALQEALRSRVQQLDSWAKRRGRSYMVTQLRAVSSDATGASQADEEALRAALRGARSAYHALAGAGFLGGVYVAGWPVVFRRGTAQSRPVGDVLAFWYVKSK